MSSLEVSSLDMSSLVYKILQTEKGCNTAYEQKKKRTLISLIYICYPFIFINAINIYTSKIKMIDNILYTV